MQPPEGTVAAAVPVTDSTIEARDIATVPVTAGDQGAHGGDIHLPPPSIWPFTTAAGLSLGGLGLVTSIYISFLGLIIMAWGIFAWVQELRHERH